MIKLNATATSVNDSSDADCRCFAAIRIGTRYVYGTELFDDRREAIAVAQDWIEKTEWAINNSLADKFPHKL